MQENGASLPAAVSKTLSSSLLHWQWPGALLPVSCSVEVVVKAKSKEHGKDLQ